MKPDPNRDYTNLTFLCAGLGLLPYKSGYQGLSNPGIYSYGGLEAPIDLSACAEDQISILKTAMIQLSKDIDDAYYEAKERDSRN